MGKYTGIQWCDHTWNPWQGCHKVSPGCDNCYMYRDKKRYSQDPNKVVLSSDKTFYLPYKFKDPARVFVCSWSDFFIKESDNWRFEAWGVIADCPHLEFLLLTKRHERIEKCLPNKIPTNIRIGVTAENQEMWDKRVPYLDKLPINVPTFVSVEPMLEQIRITKCYKVDWVICGGESGPYCRKMDSVWAAQLSADCALYDIPFFMKQMSGVTKKEREAIPDCLNIKEFPINT